MNVTSRLLVGVAAITLISQGASAQTTVPVSEAPASATPASADETPPPDKDIIVTGTARPRRRLTTSISISAVDATDLARLAPLGSADLLRNIPGLRSESSGGETNANIAVRGLPSASGGAKFVQFQEDGLPVLDFGDIAFATADTFLRPDYNIQRVEVLRGGSASTFTSNAPGAVINFISKTGDVAGGSIGFSRGIDFDRTRLDADYGAPIGHNWTFHVGGFYRIGKGLRNTGYTAERGGQFKANVTRKFDNGFIRLSVKVLDDRSPLYMPTPARITGTADKPVYESVPDFDLRFGTTLSPYFRSDTAIGHDGNRIASDLADGYRIKTRGGGAQASFDLGDGFNLSDLFNVASNSGSVITSFPADVAPLATLASRIGGAGATVAYASGPNAGRAIADPARLNGNGLGLYALTFGVTLNDFTNATNILSLTRDYHLGAFKGSIALGYFKSFQKLSMDWHWNSYLEEAKGRRAALLDVYDSAGQPVTQNGLIAYGEPIFGNCCQRFYNVDYNIDAPYFGANFQIGGLNVGGSIRYNISSASGFYAGPSRLGMIDVNQDGRIQTPERGVPVVDLNAAQPVDYRKSYLTYSVGVNYEIAHDVAVFGRVSRGARFNADHLLFGGGVREDGSIADEVAVNFVDQQDLGIKLRSGPLFANVTAFRALTAETNEIAVPVQMLVKNHYRSYGVEFEGGFDRGIFHLLGGATYTHARISESEVDPTLDGHIPYRQAAIVFQATPSIDTGRFVVGLNVTGTTSSYAGDSNTLKMPGYVLTNGFASFDVTPTIRLGLNAQNLFNVTAVTEIGRPRDYIPADGIASARTFAGRNVTASAVLRF